jgi:hypothetical protein
MKRRSFAQGALYLRRRQHPGFDPGERLGKLVMDLAAKERGQPNELAPTKDGCCRLPTVIVQKKTTNLSSTNEIDGLSWTVRKEDELVAVERSRLSEPNACKPLRGRL